MGVNGEFKHSYILKVYEIINKLLYLPIASFKIGKGAYFIACGGIMLNESHFPFGTLSIFKTVSLVLLSIRSEVIIKWWLQTSSVTVKRNFLKYSLPRKRLFSVGSKWKGARRGFLRSCSASWSERCYVEVLMKIY